MRTSSISTGHTNSFRMRMKSNELNCCPVVCFGHCEFFTCDWDGMLSWYQCNVSKQLSNKLNQINQQLNVKRGFREGSPEVLKCWPVLRISRLWEVGKDQGCDLKISLKRNNSRHIPQYIHPKSALINSHPPKKLLYTWRQTCGSNKHDIVLERVTNHKWHWLAFFASFIFLVSFLSSLPPSPYFCFLSYHFLSRIIVYCTQYCFDALQNLLGPLHDFFWFTCCECPIMPWDAKGGSYLENFAFYVATLQSWHSEMQTGLGLVLRNSEDFQLRPLLGGRGS